TTTADLPGGGGTAASYIWDLLNPDNTVNMTSSGNATLATVPTFLVPKSKFGAGAMKVRLSVAIAPAATGCTAYASQAQTMPNLTGPSATLQTNGCTNLGSPCSFTVVAGS